VTTEALHKPALQACGIVKRIAQGDAAAEAEFVRTYVRGLRFLISRRVADTHLAADLVQETLRIALIRLRSGQLQQPELVGAFLRSIALNLLSNSWREQGRVTTSDFDDEQNPQSADERNGPVETLLREQYREWVCKLLAHIPRARDRELLQRHYVLEHDKAALCDELNITPRHFDRVLFRARARFRELAARLRFDL
jgi:RNA polymerase sigma-70 factor (ECF subfamily)